MTDKIPPKIANPIDDIVNRIKSFHPTGNKNCVNTDKPGLEFVETDKSVNLAKWLLELAKKDVEASELLLKNKNHALAVFHLQQSAEKTGKAIMLFTCGLIIRRHEYLDELLSEMIQFYNDVACPVARAVDELLRYMPLINTRIKQINTIDCENDKQNMNKNKEGAIKCYTDKTKKEELMKKEEFWSASLNLETEKCNGIVNFALDGLSKAKLPNKLVNNASEKIIKKFPINEKLDDEVISKILIAQSLLYSLVVQIGLNILFAIHEQPPRYPPTENNNHKDYWEYDKYNPDAPLIKKLPEFIDADKESIKQLKNAISIYEKTLKSAQIH